MRTLTRIPMYVTIPIRYGGDHPYTVPPSFRPPRLRVLSLSNYHIRNVRGSGIVQAVQAARIGGFDLIILMETKITIQAYCQSRGGCGVVCSNAITAADGDTQG